MEYAIRVTRRRTSRMSMRIAQNGDVLVSVPTWASEADVQEFINKNRAWIDGARKRTIERLVKREEFFGRLPLQTQTQWSDAVRKLDAIVRPLLRSYAPRMGVRPGNIVYKATISRWGSCKKSTRELSFSLYLLLLPEWCIEHVVVHELAHLIEANHGPRFYAIMDRHFPRWREARAETRRIYRMEGDDEDDDD